MAPVVVEEAHRRTPRGREGKPTAGLADFLRREAAVCPHERALPPSAEPQVDGVSQVLRRTVTPEAYAHFERIVRVAHVELEKLLVFRIQTLLDPVHAGLPMEVYHDLDSSSPASKQQPPRGGVTLEAIEEGQKLRQQLVGVLGRIILDFTKYAETVLHWRRDDVEDELGAGEGGIVKLTANEHQELLSRLEQKDYVYTALETKYNAVAVELRENRRNFLREKLVWKEQLRKVFSFIPEHEQARITRMGLHQAVEFYNDASNVADAEAVRDEYERVLAHIREDQKIKEDAMHAEMAELKAKLQEMEEAKQTLLMRRPISAHSAATSGTTGLSEHREREEALGRQVALLQEELTKVRRKNHSLEEQVHRLQDLYADDLEDEEGEDPVSHQPSVATLRSKSKAFKRQPSRPVLRRQRLHHLHINIKPTQDKSEDGKMRRILELESELSTATRMVLTLQEAAELRAQHCSGGEHDQAGGGLRRPDGQRSQEVSKINLPQAPHPALSAPNTQTSSSSTREETSAKRAVKLALQKQSLDELHINIVPDQDGENAILMQRIVELEAELQRMAESMQVATLRLEPASGQSQEASPAQGGDSPLDSSAASSGIPQRPRLRTADSASTDWSAVGQALAAAAAGGRCMHCGGRHPQGSMLMMRRHFIKFRIFGRSVVAALRFRSVGRSGWQRTAAEKAFVERARHHLRAIAASALAAGAGTLRGGLGVLGPFAHDPAGELAGAALTPRSHPGAALLSRPDSATTLGLSYADESATASAVGGWGGLLGSSALSAGLGGFAAGQWCRSGVIGRSHLPDMGRPCTASSVASSRWQQSHASTARWQAHHPLIGGGGLWHTRSLAELRGYSQIAGFHASAAASSDVRGGDTVAPGGSAYDGQNGPMHEEGQDSGAAANIESLVFGEPREYMEPTFCGGLVQPRDSKTKPSRIEGHAGAEWRHLDGGHPLRFACMSEAAVADLRAADLNGDEEAPHGQEANRPTAVVKMPMLRRLVPRDDPDNLLEAEGRMAVRWHLGGGFNSKGAVAHPRTQSPMAAVLEWRWPVELGGTLAKGSKAKSSSSLPDKTSLAAAMPSAGSRRVSSSCDVTALPATGRAPSNLAPVVAPCESTGDGAPLASSSVPAAASKDEDGGGSLPKAEGARVPSRPACNAPFSSGEQCQQPRPHTSGSCGFHAKGLQRGLPRPSTATGGMLQALPGSSKRPARGEAALDGLEITGPRSGSTSLPRGSRETKRGGGRASASNVASSQRAFAR